LSISIFQEESVAIKRRIIKELIMLLDSEDLNKLNERTLRIKFECGLVAVVKIDFKRNKERRLSIVKKLA
jgi:hypothetical protein